MTTEGRARELLTRAFADIAHTLESSDDSEQRIQRTLEILRLLVPYRYCALYTSASPHARGDLYKIPPLRDAEERAELTAKLASVMRATVSDSSEEPPPSEGRAHLTLPVIGLDRVIGVIRVEPSDSMIYDSDHVSLLSVVCAQLGAYLTGMQLQVDRARRLHDLQAAHDFQRMLVAVVGHDLRNPLSVILAASTMLEHSGVAPDTHHQISTRIQRNVRRAAKIIDDLLDVTQIQLAGGLLLRRCPTNLVQLVGELTNDIRAAQPDRQVELETGDGPIDVDCDPDRIAQVVTNLLGNALRYGSKEAPVRVSLSADAREARFSVHNGGSPIPIEMLPFIFDPFKRGAPKTTKHSLGLGLYIVDEIVRSHEGNVSVRSDEQETVFTVSLPRVARNIGGAPFSRIRAVD